MKKLLSTLAVALAILILLPGHAFSRGGFRGGGGGGGRGGGNNDERPTPAPTPAATPTPAPSPVQGVISNVTPFAISIKATPQSAEQTYKVGSTTIITLNSIPTTIAALKPGMLATVTPSADKVYSTSIVASLPVAAPAATPAAVASSVPQTTQPSAPVTSTPVSAPAGGTPPPFGRPVPMQ